MRPHIANFINAIVLISLSSWGYFSSDTPSITALIPTFIGIILLICSPGVKKESKIIAHVAVLLTLVILAGLIKPLFGALYRGDTVAIIRVCIMILSSVIAMIIFIRNFIDAKKKRQLENSNN